MRAASFSKKISGILAVVLLLNAALSPSVLLAGSPGFELTPEPLTNAQAVNDLVIRANVKGNAGNVAVKYRTAPGMVEKSANMVNTSGSAFEAVIPKADLWSPDFSYTVQAVDAGAGATVTSDVYHIAIQQKPVASPNSLPKLLITELVPSSTDVGSSEGYEYVEIYNNTNKSINMKDYRILYRYPAATPPDPDVVVDITEDKVIGPQEAFVVWTGSKDNASKTAADFNANFHSNIAADHLTKVNWNGMANGSERTLIIADDNHAIISYAKYNVGMRDVVANKGITYKYDEASNQMVKLGNSEIGNPGVILPGQVPSQPVDAAAVTLPAQPNVSIQPAVIKQAAGLAELKLSAQVLGDALPGSVKTYYRTGAGMSEKSLEMTNVAGSTYEAVIPKEDVWSGTLQYWMQAQERVGAAIVKSDVLEVSVQLPEAADPNSLSKLLVTEVAPKTTDVGGSDGYEFVEVYNNTNQPINMKDYRLVYRYPAATPPDPDKVIDLTEDKVIGPQESFVVWTGNAANAGKTVADFNANYKSQLKEDHLTKVNWGGMANSSERTLIIADKFGKEFSSAKYNSSAENKGIVYRLDFTSKDMVKVGYNDLATPGTILKGQVPTKPVTVPSGAAPVLAHTPISQVNYGADVSFNVTVTSISPVTGVLLYYKQGFEAEYRTEPMKAVDGKPNLYAVELLAKKFWAPSFTYYIEATDGNHVVKTQVNTAQVQQPAVNEQAMPQLLITELVPDSTDVQDSDGYEFIEVYNNTDTDLNMDDYKLHYRYPMYGPEADLIWAPAAPHLVIKPGKTLVFWVINGSNNASTVSDFNANYGTNLVENQDIVRLYSNGMANGSAREMVITTNTNKEISHVAYNDELGVDDTEPNKGILYKFSPDGAKRLIKISSGKLAATPGSVLPVQVPSKLVHVPADVTTPVITNYNAAASVAEMDDFKVIAAAKDDQMVKTMNLYYKIGAQSNYTKVNLNENYNDTLYHFTIYSPELIGNASMDYYFEAGDGTNVTTSPHYLVAITRETETAALRLNVKNGDVLSGERTVKGASNQVGPDKLELDLDGNKLNGEPALEKSAYFAFEVKDTDLFFKNGVTIGQEILKIFDDDSNGTYMTIKVPIEPERFAAGKSPVISIRSGNKVSPFQPESKENRDNFLIKNVRLVLMDGTVLRDSHYADPARELAAGDDGDTEVFDFQFTVPADKLRALAYKWNTRGAVEGKHVLKVKESGGAEATAQILVDNTPPVIVPTMQEGQVMKGSFTLGANVTDAIAGVDQVEIKLDDQVIQAPYATSSAVMKSGAHTLKAHASDKAGNVSEVTVHFNVVEEMPYKPELISPLDGASAIGESAVLSVKVTDPTKDDMKVTFYRGYEYDATKRQNVSAYRHEVDVEPPKELAPAGEKAFTEEDYEKIKAADGTYLTQDSATQFPYQRFDVKLADNVKDGDAIELFWQGQSLAGRKVTLYAWNNTERKWVPVASRVAGQEDFTLKSNVSFKDYVVNQTVHAMVQDLIPQNPSEYDYTFVWMSDTQYYAKSYPAIYDKIVNWIADNRERMKIKYVFHTGDIVDEDEQEYQWKNADRDMKVLDDAGIPYGVLAGNHDVGHKAGDYSHYNKYFGEQRFKDRPYYGESYKDNRGHYDLISANGNDYIMVYMGWNIGDEEIAWMHKVVSEHPDRKAILNFHEYLLVSGNRSPLGEKIYQQVVVPNKNVIAVLCGHYHDSELKVDEVDDDGDGKPDRKVFQILADYQDGPNGGDGYIRLLHVDAKNNKIQVNTYSPFKNDYNFYKDAQKGKDEFTIDMNLQPDLKRIATDTFKVNVYTSERIGEPQRTASGEAAKVSWNRLSANTGYEWYAVAEDAFGGVTKSDIWSFTTGAVDPSGQKLTVSFNSRGGTAVPSQTVSSGEKAIKPAAPLKPGYTFVGWYADQELKKVFDFAAASITSNITLYAKWSEDRSESGSGSSGSVSSKPDSGKPEVEQPITPNAERQWTVQPSVEADGSLRLANAELLKKLGQTQGGQFDIIVDLKSGTYRGQALQLDSAWLEKAKSQRVTVRIVTPTSTVSIPPTALPAEALQAGSLALRVSLEQPGAADNRAPQAWMTDSAYRGAGLNIVLQTAISQNGQSKSIVKWNAPLKVEYALDQEAVKRLHSDLVGVYDLGSPANAYVGGKLQGSRIVFTAGQPGTFAIAEYVKEFADMTGHWAQKETKQLAAKHIVNGMDTTRFEPNAQVTRAQFATMIVRALGHLNNTASSVDFRDVPAGAYYAANVAKAVSLGLIEGDRGAFRPDEQVTREEAVVLAMRAYRILYGEPATSGAAAVFEDANQIAAWAQRDVQEAGRLGLIHGRANHLFVPGGSMTRAESVKVIAAMLQG